MPQVLRDLLNSEKGLIAVVLLVAATVLTALGQMPLDTWTWYTLGIAGVHGVGTGLRAIGAGRPRLTPPGSSATLVGEINTNGGQGSTEP